MGNNKTTRRYGFKCNVKKCRVGLFYVVSIDTQVENEYPYLHLL